jgi:hypothetical protein
VAFVVDCSGLVLLRGGISWLMEFWGQELMVSLDSLVDKCVMIFGAMIYHQWMIILVMISLKQHSYMAPFYYDFGLMDFTRRIHLYSHGTYFIKCPLEK